MNRHRLSRRMLLRGAGAALALPLLEAMTPRLALASGRAAAAPPVRMGIFTVTGGTVLESWKLPQAGSLAKLPSILRPLEAYKDDVLLLTGLSHSGRSENLNAHEHCAYLHLTGAPAVRRERGKPVAAISVDQVAAATLGKRTLLPSLEVGMASNQYSFRGPDSPVPFEGNPRIVFDRMFRGRQPVAPNWARRGAGSSAGEGGAGPAAEPPDSPDQAVLDLVLEQVHDLRRSLGRADQRKLDEYFEAVRSVEKRVAFLEARQREDALDLASPGRSRPLVPGSLPRAGTPIWEISRPMDHDPERHGDYIRLLADLMVLAFQTDTTRVMTVAAGSDDCLFPGVVTVGYEHHCHTLEHQGNAGRVEDADPIAREACRQIHAWYTQLFAEMVGKLKAIDEGGSSLLDNCLILYTSYMSDGGHGRVDYPALLAGRAGGTLKTGRQVTFETKAPVANLYVEMLNRVGVPTERFGDSHTSEFAGSFNGRLPGLC